MQGANYSLNQGFNYKTFKTAWIKRTNGRTTSFWRRCSSSSPLTQWPFSNFGTRKKDDFFLTLDPPSSFLRGTLCFFWYKLSALGSTRKHPNHRLKVAKMNCQFCAGKWLVGLATLGRCHWLCCLNQPERLTLTCSQVSQDLLRVRYIQCGEETRRQMPWEGGHPTSLAGEGDEQYLTI